MLRKAAPILMIAAAVGLYSANLSAHCDSLDGPVVQAARAAFEKNDVRLVLRWVEPDQEAVIRAAFDQARAVRALGPDAKALADRWFFETLVRIHRAGEGAPFDGLKPAGQIEPFIAAVDRSLTSGSADEVLSGVTADVTRGVRERFAAARDARAKADDNVDAGRRFVAAYVDYLHYVERLHQAGTPAAGHAEGPLPASAPRR